MGLNQLQPEFVGEQLEPFEAELQVLLASRRAQPVLAWPNHWSAFAARLRIPAPHGKRDTTLGATGRGSM